MRGRARSCVSKHIAADGYVSAGGFGGAGWDGMGWGDRRDGKAMRVSSAVLKAFGHGRGRDKLSRHVLRPCASDNPLEKTRLRVTNSLLRPPGRDAKEILLKFVVVHRGASRFRACCSESYTSQRHLVNVLLARQRGARGGRRSFAW